MSNGIRKIAIFTIVAGMLAGNLLAAPFEELFQIKNISGKCYVKTVNNAKFVKAEPNKAYPYGTTIKTDKKGSATIFFSKDNTCVLKANTVVVLSEEEDKKNKVLTIDAGNIDVNLDKEFHKSNGLKVVTATGICKAIGCVFSIGQSSTKDKTAVTFDCKEGEVGVAGDDYEAPKMGDNNILAVTSSKDNGESRVEVVKGDIDLKLKNAQGKPELKKFKEGSVIKIWRRASESGNEKIVTRLSTDPEGKLSGAVTYTVPMQKAEALPKAAAVAVPVKKAVKDKQEEGGEEGGEEWTEMQATDKLMREPDALGLSSALGDAVIHRLRTKAAGTAGTAVVVPKPKPKPDPTPSGSRS